MKQYESKIIDNKIAYWKFLRDATPETFAAAFEEFNVMVRNPDIIYLMVDVEMKNAWGKDIQGIWLKTGEVADQCNIKKWVVVTKDTTKKLTVRHLIRGGGESRGYDHYVAESVREGLNWINATEKEKQEA